MSGMGAITSFSQFSLSFSTAPVIASEAKQCALHFRGLWGTGHLVERPKGNHANTAPF